MACVDLFLRNGIVLENRVGASEIEDLVKLHLCNLVEGAQGRSAPHQLAQAIVEEASLWIAAGYRPLGALDARRDG